MEQDTQVHNKPLNYKGVFSVRELYNEINKWFEENRYDYSELENNETIKETGKTSFLKIEGIKGLTEYSSIALTIKINLEDVKEVVVEVDNKNEKLDQGNVNILFDAHYQTELEHSFETKPFYRVVKDIIEHYITTPFTKKPQGIAKSELSSLYARIKAFLNLYRYV